MQEAPGFPLLQDYRLTAASLNKQMTGIEIRILTALMPDLLFADFR